MALPPKTKPARRFSRLTIRAAPRPKTAPVRFRRLLVPLDFSAAANAVLAAAMSLCKRFQAELHLIHVYPVACPAPALMASSVINSESQIADAVRSHLQAVAKDHGLRSQRVRLHARAGRPYEEICRLARELDIDLIMTATRGRTGLKHLALGSTAERVVRHAPCPVLVMHGPGRAASRFTPALRKILVATDFSAGAARGLDYAKALAALFRAKLILLHSVDLHYYSTNPEYMLFDLPPLLAAAEKAGRDQLQEVVAETESKNLKVEQTLASGHAGEQVCRRARELNADLIVTATHGRTGLKHVLLGSTAEYIVRHASGPVLVVPSHQRPRIIS